MTRKFTGWHAAAIFVAFFIVVTGVNLAMAFAAVSGFGGVVVENSYVASQDFNRWMAEQRREDALGWRAALSRDAGGQLVVATHGIPDGARVMADLRRPLGRPEDRDLTFREVAPGRYESTASIDGGRWIVRLEVTAEGRSWSHEARLG